MRQHVQPGRPGHYPVQDEIDSLAPQRGASSSDDITSRRLLTELLLQLNQTTADATSSLNKMCGSTGLGGASSREVSSLSLAGGSHKPGSTGISNSGGVYVFAATNRIQVSISEDVFTLLYFAGCHPSQRNGGVG